MTVREQELLTVHETEWLGELAPLCHSRDGRLLTAMSALLRLAEHLDRGRDGAVTRAQLHDQGDQIELELAVDGDAALARWGAERQSDLFRRAFGRPLTLA